MNIHWTVLLCLVVSCSCDSQSMDNGDDSHRDSSTSSYSSDASSEVESDAPGDAGLSTEGDEDAGAHWAPASCDFTTIYGGDYMMGSPEGVGNDNERPRHRVTIRTFQLMQTEVTTAAYEECVASGHCAPTPDPSFCNRGEKLADHPVTCVDWFQAKDFCEWIDGRLPTEAEWEYAARSGGLDILYPWGDEEPTCDLAVTDGESGTDRGCGLGTTWPVCSKPLGNSAHGLCDLAGNVYEWVEDWFQDEYVMEVDGETYEAPDDGGAWLEPLQSFKVMRGGGISSSDDFRASFRQFHEPEFYYGGLGARCARDI